MIDEISNQTVDYLLKNIPIIGNRWQSDDPFLPLTEEYLHHNFENVVHDISFRDTGYKDTRNIKILFFHFSMMKYELEALELPLYASKVLPNAEIDICYVDGRGRIGEKNKCYISSVVGNSTETKLGFLDHYDIVILRSSALNTMKTHFPDLYSSCDYKINIQTNNYTPNFGLGENFSLSHTEFYAPSGRKFQDRSIDLSSNDNFSKYNIITMIGSVIWWKGQLEWLQAIDPGLLKNYILLMFGPISDEFYFRKILEVVGKNKINYAYSKYVNPRFLCDILTHSKISIMNHYADPPLQSVVGPARTFGESLVCSNVCLLGQTYDDKLLEKKTNILPEAWKEYTIEYDQNSIDGVNEAFIKADKLSSSLDFSDLEMVEFKMNDIIRRCLDAYDEI